MYEFTSLTNYVVYVMWFYEESESWPGQKFGLKIKSKLYEQKSEFQNIEVFETETYGNMLALDGVIQMTERDEFAYQEMLSHVPLACHKSPKRVLVVGGGDGGCVREVLKHKSVERVDLVEIDETVIKIAKQYFKNMACGLNDPRVQIHICDGFKFLSECTNTYDVVISDSSDPEGPAEVLFQAEYFKLLHKVVANDGFIALQASENIWLNLPKLRDLKNVCGSVFPSVQFASVCVPSYTSGQLGLLFCGKSSDSDASKPLRKWSECSNLENSYYNSEIHEASFIVPPFAQQYLN